MYIFLVLAGIGLYVAIGSSSRNHKQEWLDRQPPDAGYKVYPGTFDLGEIVGCIVLAIIVLVLVGNLSGGR